MTYTTLMKTFMRAKKFEKVCHFISFFCEIRIATHGNMHRTLTVGNDYERSCFQLLKMGFKILLFFIRMVEYKIN